MPRDCNTARWLLPLLICVVPAGQGSAAATGQNWLELRSPNFSLITDAGEEAGRRALFHLEQLRAVAPASRELEIFYIHDSRSYTRQLAGTAAPPLIVAGEGAGDLRELRHEYIHAARGVDDPVWAREGIADFYAEATIEKGSFVVGLPNRSALALLRRRSLIPVAELARITEYPQDPDARMLLYAESWALAHLLMSEGRALKIEGDTGLDDRLAAHIAQGAPGGERRYPLVDLNIASFRVRVLPEAEARLRLSELLPADQERDALEELTASEAQYAPAWERLAIQHLAADNLDAAMTACDRAIALGSENAETWYLAGLLRWHYVRDTVAGERLLDRATALDPLNADYRAAWMYAKETREEREMRARLRLAMSVHSVHLLPVAQPTVRVMPVAVPRKPKPTETKTWIFAGAKLLGCSGPPSQQVCMYSR